MLLIIWCLLLYLLFTFFLIILFYLTFKFSYILHIIKLFIFPHFFILKIKYIIFYLNSINKIVLIKWGHARETLILTPNTLKENGIQNKCQFRNT